MLNNVMIIISWYKAFEMPWKHHHLDDVSPHCLHGHRDEADDGIGEGEVEDQVVHVGPAHQIYPGGGGAGGGGEGGGGGGGGGGRRKQ